MHIETVLAFLLYTILIVSYCLIVLANISYKPFNVPGDDGYPYLVDDFGREGSSVFH